MKLEEKGIVIVKTARDLLKSPENGEQKKIKASEKTRDAYLIEYERLNKLCGGSRKLMLEEARKTTSSATWYRRKAALSLYIKENLAAGLKEQDQIQRQLRENHTPELEKQWQSKLQILVNDSKFLKSLNEAGPLPAENRKKRATKKRSLRGLPDNWREDISARMIKYKAPFLVAALTGCRPQELADGVKLEIVDGSIKATIKGAKVTENAGQLQREILIEVDGKLANDLAELVKNGINEVSLESPANFTTAIRDAGRREYKNRSVDLSAYSLRHQFASDMKADDFSVEDIAKAMGHVSDKTASYYGNKQQSRGGGPKVKSVTASREVKHKPNMINKMTKKLKLKIK